MIPGESVAYREGQTALINRVGYERELDVAISAAREAGAAILDFYQRQSAGVYEKADGSVVTDADLAADRIIREHITAAFPGDPLLTEEGADDSTRLQTGRCWVVDPIDGTQQFVSRTGEFEVLIALVEQGRPVLGVVYQPTGNVLISAVNGQGANIEVSGSRQPLRFNAVSPSLPPRIVTSTWLGAPANLPLVNAISASLHGNGAIVSDIGITVRRFVPPGDIADTLIGMRINDDTVFAWEWDFAAPDIIVRESGGSTTDLFGNLHQYNKPVPRNVGGIVMSVDPLTQNRVLDALAHQRNEQLAGGIRPGR